MSLLYRIRKCVAELLITPWTTDILGREVSSCFEEHRAFRADRREDAFDSDAVFPTVAKVVKVFERFPTGVLDCRQQ